MSVETSSACYSRGRHDAVQLRASNARRGGASSLERTDRGLKHVASDAGFGSVDVMRRAFVGSWDYSGPLS